jgi:hypothetical protein
MHPDRQHQPVGEPHGLHHVDSGSLVTGSNDPA